MERTAFKSLAPASSCNGAYWTNVCLQLRPGTSYPHRERGADMRACLASQESFGSSSGSSLGACSTRTWWSLAMAYTSTAPAGRIWSRTTRSSSQSPSSSVLCPWQSLRPSACCTCFLFSGSRPSPHTAPRFGCRYQPVADHISDMVPAPTSTLYSALPVDFDFSLYLSDVYAAAVARIVDLDWPAWLCVQGEMPARPGYSQCQCVT